MPLTLNVSKDNNSNRWPNRFMVYQVMRVIDTRISNLRATIQKRSRLPYSSVLILRVKTMKGFSITTDSSQFDFNVIYDFIRQSYWAKDIPATVMQKAIENSLCFAVLDNDNHQVGFARVITDYATFGYLADVFIVEEQRGKGLSKWLVDTIVKHPDLQGLRRLMLATYDAHGLYAQYGFEPVVQPENLMQIWDPNVYQRES